MFSDADSPCHYNLHLSTVSLREQRTQPRESKYIFRLRRDTNNICCGRLPNLHTFSRRFGRIFTSIIRFWLFNKSWCGSNWRLVPCKPHPRVYFILFCQTWHSLLIGELRDSIHRIRAKMSYIMSAYWISMASIRISQVLESSMFCLVFRS